jgi:hypothetical protein
MPLSMPNSGPRRVFYIAITLLQMCWHVRAYAIHSSCKTLLLPDGTLVDKSYMIYTSMIEAKDMATLAEEAIVGPIDEYDNSRSVLFMDATIQDYWEVQGKSHYNASDD